MSTVSTSWGPLVVIAMAGVGCHTRPPAVTPSRTMAAAPAPAAPTRPPAPASAPAPPRPVAAPAPAPLTEAELFQRKSLDALNAEVLSVMRFSTTTRRCCVTMPNGPCNRMRPGCQMATDPDQRRRTLRRAGHRRVQPRIGRPPSGGGQGLSYQSWRRVESDRHAQLGQGGAVLPRFRRILLVTESARSFRHYGEVRRSLAG